MIFQIPKSELIKGWEKLAKEQSEPKKKGMFK